MNLQSTLHFIPNYLWGCCLALLLALPVAAQQSVTENVLHTQPAILQFARHLYCEKDFLRSALEHERLTGEWSTDTTRFLIALSYERLGRFDDALYWYDKVSGVLREDARSRSTKVFFQRGEYAAVDSIARMGGNQGGELAGRFRLLAGLIRGEPVSDASVLFSFPAESWEELTELQAARLNPPQKSPLLAGTLSALIPGAGKLYTGEYGDGITALVMTSLMAFLAVDNFNQSHELRGWIFSAAAAFFYGGNIYGSAKSAEMYNDRQEREWRREMNSFIEGNDYFLPPAYEPECAK